MVSSSLFPFKKKIPVCDHIGLFVRQLNPVRRFYVQKLGFKCVRKFTADVQLMKAIFGISSPCQVQTLDHQGLGLELFCFKNTKLRKRLASTAGWNHWTLLVEDKYRFVERLRRQRVKVIQVAKPGGHVFMIKDPEGNLIEIKSYPPS